MNFKDVLKNNPFTVTIIFLSTLISGITFIYSKPLAFAELALILLFVVFALKWISNSAERKKDFFNSIEEYLAETGEAGKFNSNFPFPLVLSDKEGNIQWFNKSFGDIIDSFGDNYSDNIKTLIPDFSELILSNVKHTEIATECSQYSVISSSVNDNLSAFYFIDDTELKNIRTNFNLTRPVAILINVDSLEHTEDTFAHADYYAVVSDVEREITKWLVENNCIFRKFADGKFIAATESSNLDLMIKDNFNILDKIRLYRYGSQEVDITLSVGIGKEKTFTECEISARQALDMARGRGGDQVVLKINNNYEFFGGVTSRKEKRGKIKSRIIATALSEYIENSSSVFVMGHAYSDFDAIGAAVGLCSIAKSCSKPSYIIINKQLSLALPLVEMLEKLDKNIKFVSQSEAMEIFNNESLLIIADTMREKLVEAPEILKRAKNIILIDHHRKTVDYIDSAVLEFHEPYASSACEMVTELIQYSPSKTKLSSYEAEALLAGIILDTKNYTLRVGVRTFEAAAYLKDCKADTVNVKKLFASSVEDNVSVNRLIAGAQFYDRYAIAVADSFISRLVSSKTADEMLNISGVDASFVVSCNDDTTFISSRSLGKINVQLIMEALGGGGHQSMAACQIKGTDIENAVTTLKNAINDYFIKNS